MSFLPLWIESYKTFVKLCFKDNSYSSKNTFWN